MGRLFDTKLELDRLFVIPETDVVIDEETGEVLNKEYVDELMKDFESGVKYLLQEEKNIESDIVAYKAQKDIFAKKQKSAENRRDSLKQYLSALLNGHSFEADDKSVKATFRKSESVNIISIDNLSDKYKTTKTEVVADKKAIKEAIKGGLEVFGAELVQNNCIQIK